MINLNELQSAPLDISDEDDHASRHALYCPQTGRRLAPERGMAPPAGTTIAVLVFEDGSTVSVNRHAVLGRAPEPQRSVATDACDGVIVEDASGATSRSHLLLRLNNWDLEAIDLASQNGTLVLGDDGQWLRLTPGLAHRVTDGQRLRIGSRTIAVHYTGRAAS